MEALLEESFYSFRPKFLLAQIPILSIIRYIDDEERIYSLSFLTSGSRLNSPAQLAFITYPDFRLWLLRTHGIVLPPTLTSSSDLNCHVLYLYDDVDELSSWIHLPMGVAYDLLPSTGNVWKSTTVTQMEFDIPDGVAQPLLLQITFRGQSECHSPGLFSEVVLEFRPRRFQQLETMSAMTLNYLRLASSLICQRLLHDLMAMPKNEQLAFKTAYINGWVACQASEDDERYYALEEFLKSYSPLFRTRKMASTVSKWTRPNTPGAKQGMIYDFANWGLQMVTSKIKTGAENEARPLLTSADQKIPNNDQPEQSSENINFDNVPVVRRLITAKLSVNLDQIRIPIRLNVWGPPLLRRLTSFPGKVDSKRRRSGIRFAATFVTIQDVIMGSLPENVARSLVEIRDLSTPPAGWIRMDGIDLPPESPLLWWFSCSAKWNSILEINIRLF